MIKPLIGVAVVLGGVLGVQWTVQQRSQLEKAQTALAAIEARNAAEPVQVLGFALDQGAEKTLATADLVGQEVALLYLYSNTKRDPAMEKNLALIAKENPKTVRIVAVRDAESKGPVPEELQKLGSTATDAKGALAQGYRVKALPAIVVLKSRPVYHTAFTPETSQVEQLEPVVDSLVARDDLVPVEGGCGGGCGGGGGGCMASEMIAQGGPGGCSH